MSTTLNIDTIILGKGEHPNRGQEVCLMEAVAWYAGEPHSYIPNCVSNVLQNFGVNLNDELPDERRQELKPLIPRLVGTAGDGRDTARSFMARDWLLHTYLPVWLQVAQLPEHAQALRSLPRSTGQTNLTAHQAALDTIITTLDACSANDNNPALDQEKTSSGFSAAFSAACYLAPDVVPLNRRITQAATGAIIAARGRPSYDNVIPQLQASAIDLFKRMIAPA